MNKKPMLEVKNISRFLSTGHQIKPSSGRKAREILRNLNEIHLVGPQKQYLAENISLQRSNCNIFGLTDTLALFANEARFFRFRVFFRACSLESEVKYPPFSKFLTSLTHHLTVVKVSERNQCCKIFARTSLKGVQRHE